MISNWRYSPETPNLGQIRRFARFARSSVICQGLTALKLIEFDPNWAFRDCNSSLNSPMAMKYCTKLETAKERCPIVFHGHPSNFKVTRDKTSPILTQIVHFWTIGRSQLSNPSDLHCYNGHGQQYSFSTEWYVISSSSIFFPNRIQTMRTEYMSNIFTTKKHWWSCWWSPEKPEAHRAGNHYSFMS